MFIGFHSGISSTAYAMTSLVSRSEWLGGKMNVPRERYSLRMSFCVVPLSSFGSNPPLAGERDVEREEPRRRRVDRHRRVHLLDRDAVEERAHVPEVRDGHADFANFAGSERVVRVVSGLRGQIEGDAEARSGLWPGCGGRARSRPRAWSAPSTSA